MSVNWTAHKQLYSLQIQEMLSLFDSYFNDKDLTKTHILFFCQKNYSQEKVKFNLEHPRYLLIIARDMEIECSYAKSLPTEQEVAIDIIILEGAHVSFSLEQTLPHAAQEKTTYQCFLGADAQLDCRAVWLGAHKSDVTFACHMLATGAAASLEGRYLFNTCQKATITTKQYHYAAHTTSNFHVNGFITDNASMNYRGTVIIEEPASHAQAQQYNKNLLGSSMAQAISIPSLEVKTNEVRCQHGSAIGFLDEQHLFYLKSRGFDDFSARRLLITAFLSNDGDYFSDALSKKLSQLFAQHCREK